MPETQVDPNKARAREELARVKDEERARNNRHWSDKPLDEMTERDWCGRCERVGGREGGGDGWVGGVGGCLVLAFHLYTFFCVLLFCSTVLHCSVLIYGLIFFTCHFLFLPLALDF
jgi:hypothetical protein